MENETQWYKSRDQWRKPTNEYPKKSPDVYKPSQLTMEICDMIGEIIVSTRGPYPRFPKKINLSDLVAIVEEVWQDDNDFDFGSYAPTVGVNSRSGSMKKLARKNDKSNDNKPVSRNNDFDQLDDLLNGDVKSKKKDTSLSKNQSISQLKKGNDTIDSFFDQPSTNLNLTSKINDKRENSPSKMDMARTSIFLKNDKTDKKSDFDIIDEDHLLPNFSKPLRNQSPTNNQIKLSEQSMFGLDSHTSMRNMRPPMKRKESQTNLGNNNNLNLGLSLADEKKQLTFGGTNNFGLSLMQEPQLKPSRSIGSRRGSMDNKSEKKLETGLTLFGQQPPKKQVNISQFNFQDKRQVSALRIQSPKNKGRSQMSEMKIGESIMINDKHSQFYNQQSIMLSRPEDLKTSQAHIIDRRDSNYSFEKPSAKLVEPPKLSPHKVVDQKKAFNDYQKEIEHIKLAYQKQLTYLQQSLDKQISISQQTRERLMKQANSMIDEQRKRMGRMHEEQVRRLKEMNEWQKTKMQSSYKFEIDNLKSTISQYQQAKDKTQNTNSYQQLGNNKYKREIQLLSQQLQTQKKVLLDRENHLTKRQYQLQQKYHQINNKKMKQQEYYRDQQKALLDKQNKLRNGILNQKKQFMEEKQKLAMQAANMEIDFMRRRQKLQLLIRQQQMEKKSIQNQRHEMRVLNQQMMTRYKQKMNELGQDKQRVSSMQAQLIRKLRIVEMKAKQSNIPLGETQQSNNTKENNWVRDRPQSSAAGNNKQQKLNETFQRYNKVQKMANQKSIMSVTMNKTLNEQTGQNFKLDDYLNAMNKNSKTRNNNFM